MEGELVQAREVISEGGRVIFPTETAYGIAADATNPEAIDKVYEMKRRPRSKGLTTIVSSVEQAEKFAEMDESERSIVEEFMPGPITLVAEKKEIVPDELNEKFVFRVSSSEIARKLASDTPITATSANISGGDTSYSVQDIDSSLREKADFIIDEGELENSPTSTIVEIVNGELRMHREGPIKKEQIKDSI
ncbi:MAG: L-threonylcarbamoyladenylate synthase [Candidatus Nanohaloarchaea archaeon]